MTTKDELVKRILLNIKYDSKKTLSENKKRVLKEEGNCSEIRQQIVLNLDQDTYGVKGQIRSRKYPKWGKWGDGRCICGSYNPPEGYTEMCSFETGFSVKCCKNQKTPQRVVSADKPSFEKYDPQKNQVDSSGNFFDDSSYDGTPLKLPTDVKNIKRTECGKQKMIFQGDAEKMKLIKPIANVCRYYTKYNMLSDFGFESEDACLIAFGDQFITFCKDDSVESFEYNGLVFTPCFGNIGKGPERKKPEDMQFKGYYGADELARQEAKKDNSTECVGQKWNVSTGIPEKTDTKPQNTIDNTTVEGPGIEGGLGSEEATMSFIF